MNNINDTDASTDAPLDDELLQYIAAVSRFEVPSDFLGTVVSQFESATRLRLWKAWMVGISACLAAASTIIWVVIFNLSAFSKVAAAAGNFCMYIFKSILLLWRENPELSTGLLIGLWISIFAILSVLLKTSFSASLTSDALHHEQIVLFGNGRNK